MMRLLHRVLVSLHVLFGPPESYRPASQCARIVRRKDGLLVVMKPREVDPPGSEHVCFVDPVRGLHTFQDARGVPFECSYVAGIMLGCNEPSHIQAELEAYARVCACAEEVVWRVVQEVARRSTNPLEVVSGELPMNVLHFQINRALERYGLGIMAWSVTEVR